MAGTEAMIPEIDIWRSAQVMVKRYGQDAPTEAAARAEEMLDQGDRDGFAIWQRITAAVEELLRAEPRPGERVQ